MDKITIEEAKIILEERKERLEELYRRTLQEKEDSENVCQEKGKTELQVQV